MNKIIKFSTLVLAASISTHVEAGSLEQTLLEACDPFLDQIQPDFCTGLDPTGSTTSFETAVAAMTPNQLGSQAGYSVTASSSQNRSINNRLQELRSEGDESNQNSLHSNLASGGAASADALLGKGIGVFGTILFNEGERDKTSLEDGYDWSGNYISGGADYRLSNNIIVGGSIGVANNDSSFDANRGTMKADSKAISAYGSFYDETGYIDWNLSYGDFEYNTRRNVVFLSVDTSAEGTSDGSQLSLSISGGRDYFIKDKTVSPYVNLSYVNSSIDAYTETSASSYSYAISEQSLISLISTWGVRVSQAKSFSWGVLSPTAHIEWLHEFRSDSRAINSSFTVDPNTVFDTSTDSPDRNFFNLGAAISATLPGGYNYFASLSTVLAQKHTSNTVIGLGLRLEL